MDARLGAGLAAPVCVAVSGGGDSMALLALACAWGEARGRSVLALSIDHGLQADSAAWSGVAVETARRLGAEGRVLAWTGDKPLTGLTAAARAARHALLADAARAAGGRVLLMAHTADDIEEAAVMRAEGSNLGSLRDWGPSPAWPEGRGVFVLRPLLGESRAGLRAFLTACGIGWIEDPANNDPKYGRSRARAQLSVEPFHQPPVAASPRPGMPEELKAMFEGLRETGGGISFSRQALRDADPAAARRFLSAALLCAAGTDRPPRGERLDALLARLNGPGGVAATLAGARVQAVDDEILIGREAPRGGLPRLPVRPGGVSVWDGRFEILVNEDGLAVVAAAGRMARLSAADRKEILALSPILRGSQPLLVGCGREGGETRPVLAAGVASVRCLTLARLRAACGQIAHETEFTSGLVAPEPWSSYVGNSGPTTGRGI